MYLLQWKADLFRNHLFNTKHMHIVPKVEPFCQKNPFMALRGKLIVFFGPLALYFLYWLPLIFVNPSIVCKKRVMDMGKKFWFRSQKWGFPCKDHTSKITRGVFKSSRDVKRCKTMAESGKKFLRKEKQTNEAFAVCARNKLQILMLIDEHYLL